MANDLFNSSPNATTKGAQTMNFTTCPTCQGTGEVWSEIEETIYDCYTCKGHKQIPTGSSDRPKYYYKPAEWKYGYLTQRVAVLSCDLDEPGSYRVTKYSPNGPMGHYTTSGRKIMQELSGFIDHPIAGRTLDAWSKTHTWRKGAKQCQYIALQNLLCGSREIRQKVYDLLDKNPSLDEMIAALLQLKRLHMPEASIF